MGRKLAVLASLGLLLTLVLGIVAVRGVTEIDRTYDRLSASATARQLAAQLDTRASELKVDAYKSLVAADPAEPVADFEEDTATAKALVEELAALELDAAAEAQVAAIQAASRTYVEELRAVVEGAVADQAAARADYSGIQAANDKSDAVLEEAGAVLTADLARDDVELHGVFTQVRRTTYLATGLGLLALLGTAFLVTRSITRPLRSAVASLDKVAAGDLSVRLEARGTDEVAQVATAVNTALQSFGTAMHTIDSSASSLAAAAEEMAATSGQIGASARDAQAQADAVSAAAEQVSRNVQTVATGSEEMGASIREIAHSANEAARVAAQAVGVAETTNATVAKLGESSVEIGNVVKVITS
ncbi:methyl-accepting chemotaxis protein, partial [Vallicoccus soli]